MILLAAILLDVLLLLYVVAGGSLANKAAKTNNKVWVKILLYPYLFWLWPTLWLMPRSWVDWILFS